MDDTRYTTADTDTQLSNFYEIPEEIFNTTWNTNGGLDSLIQPWELWLSNKRVANRVSNYRNFKGIMHVKFLINGNMFYWGKAFASYHPLTAAPLTRYENNFISIMPALQRPHIWIDPTTSQGGQLVLPFFRTEDCIDLTRANPGQDMGTIWIKSLVDLQHTQSLTDPVRLTVYAWCEGVELSSPTQTNVGALTPQSGTMDEMQTDGPVSKPASIVQKVAGALSKVPAIAPYALATQAAAGTIARVASAMGYSRPREIEVEKPMKIWQTGNLANVDQKDTINTLALTTKQEVTIDPRTTGLGDTDELAFSHLNSIWSYLANAEWLSAYNPKQVIISIPVTPGLWNRDTTTLPVSESAYVFTTTAFTATPFEYWRGSMEFRFQLAASGYHKGRLLVVWDPITGSTDPEVNVVYSRIIDIAEERDFTVKVGWGSSTPALLNRVPFATEYPSTYTLGALTVPNLNSDNGVLTVYVLNDLVTSGDNTAPVRLLVSTRSTDLEVWNPESVRIKSSTYNAQFPVAASVSEDKTPLVPQAGTIEVPISDSAETADAVNPVGGNEKLDVFSIIAGESIDSFRTCMKRYTLLRRIVWDDDVLPGVIQSMITSTTPYPEIRRPAIPAFWSDFPTTMYGYVHYAYYGFRGSTRYRYVPRIAGSEAPLDLFISSASVSRDDAVGNTAPFTSDAIYQAAGTMDAVAFDTDESWSGTIVTNKVAGDVLECEVPFYGFFRFAIAGAGLSRGLGHSLQAFAINTGDAEVPVLQVWDQFISTGEDYNLFFFLGVPAMWRTF